MFEKFKKPELFGVPGWHFVPASLATSLLVARKGNVRWQARAAGLPTHISLASGAWPREHDESNGYTTKPCFLSSKALLSKVKWLYNEEQLCMILETIVRYWREHVM